MKLITFSLLLMLVPICAFSQRTTNEGSKDSNSTPRPQKTTLSDSTHYKNHLKYVTAKTASAFKDAKVERSVSSDATLVEERLKELNRPDKESIKKGSIKVIQSRTPKYENKRN